MKNSIKENIARGALILGATTGAADLVACGENLLRPYDEGRIHMQSAVSGILGIDVAYDPKHDPYTIPSEINGNRYRENLLTDSYTFVSNESDTAHAQWHKPDTYTEGVAVVLGPITVGGISSITSLLALSVLFSKKKKSSQSSKE